VVHQSVSRGFAVFADAWLSGWLAEISADLRENGSALEVVLHDYALYKSTFTLLLYFKHFTFLDQLCQFVSKSLHLFSEYRLHKSVDRGEEWTDGRTDERTDGQPENIMPPAASLACWNDKTLYKELVEGDRLNKQVDLPVCIVFVPVISRCSDSCSQLFFTDASTLDVEFDVRRESSV